MLFDVNTAVRNTQKIIERQVNDGICFPARNMFSEYSAVYQFTNENINGYMSQFDFQNKSNALSVLASGDHPFNLVYNGVYDIDTFDVNKLTEYFALGIKRAAILKYTYREFLKFMAKIIDKDTSLDELISLIEGLMPFMERRHILYWKKIIAYNYKLQKKKVYPLNLFAMILVNCQLPILLKNPYLLDEEHYNKLRNALGRANISFKCANALALDKAFRGKEYDFILLSNIADYFYKSLGTDWTYDDLRKETAKMKTLLKDDGLLALAYLMTYHSSNIKLIMTSNLKREDLTSEELILFPHINENNISAVVEDGLILERKRSNE